MYHLYVVNIEDTLLLFLFVVFAEMGVGCLQFFVVVAAVFCLLFLFVSVSFFCFVLSCLFV